jgi:uroporphyrinogen-III synthase
MLFQRLRNNNCRQVLLPSIEMWINFVTLYRSLALKYTFLHAMQIEILPRTKKNLFGSNTKAAVGRILEEEWTLNKASKAY